MNATIRRIVRYGNPVLRRKAKLVTQITPELQRLCADLKATMLAAEGLGLAANQIAEELRVFAIDPRCADVDAEPYCLLNPELVATEGLVEREEGCLSLPGIYDIVPRPEMVRIRALNEQGQPVEIEATGLLARAFLHELDHLNGILFIDSLGQMKRSLMEAKLKQIEATETQS